MVFIQNNQIQGETYGNRFRILYYIIALVYSNLHFKLNLFDYTDYFNKSPNSHNNNT